MSSRPTVQTTVDVDGLNRLVKQLRNLEPELWEELKEANRELGDEIAGDARGLARRRSGTMAATIRGGGTARTGLVRAGGARVPWTGPQHFGWAARSISPNPFLYDALDRRADEVRDRYLRKLDDVTERIR